MTWLREDGPGRPHLNDFAVAHHRNRVTNLRRNAQIVRDEEHRQPEALADFS